MHRPEKSFRVNAVVLRHTDWGEADRLITLLARERGKVRAIAKGARKIKSRKAGHLEPFTRVALQLAAARDLPIITQAETLEAHLSLREDLVRTGYAAYVVELVDRFTYEDETEATGLYDVLAQTLARVAVHSDPWLPVRYYEMRLLDFLGFRPHLFHCANCGRDILPEDQFFSAAVGGVICPTCGKGLPGLWDLSVDALKYLRHFQRSSWEEAARARPLPETRAEIEILMQGYFTYLLERGLNTPGFLKRVRED
jgi:DNA repair protein RecO (recombination protein O)